MNYLSGVYVGCIYSHFFLNFLISCVSDMKVASYVLPVFSELWELQPKVIKQYSFTAERMDDVSQVKDKKKKKNEMKRNQADSTKNLK